MIIKRLTVIICCAVLVLCTFSVTAVYSISEAYENTGDSIADITEIAKNEIGYSSTPLTKYCQWVSGASPERAASFVAWCAYYAGIDSSIIPRISDNSSFLEYFKTNKLFNESAFLGGDKKPAVGSIIFLTASAGDYNALNTIGIVTGISGMSISYVEDGAGSAVSAGKCSIYNSSILGYAFPDYTVQTKLQIGIYRVNEVMNFRTGPDISYPLVKNSSGSSLSIPANTTVTVTQISGAWGMLTYSGQTGWIKLDWSEYISEVSEIVNDGEWLIVDVSSFQPETAIDWFALKSAGISGAILRIGGRYYGEASNHLIYDDGQFALHYQGAKSAGLNVGTYFFSAAYTQERAKEEAQFVLDELNKGAYMLDLPVFIDIEDIEADYKPHYAAGKQVCTMVTDTFCKTIENAGYYAGVYCSKDFAEVLLDPSVFVGRAVWIAQYNDKCTYSGDYHMWQYTRSAVLPGYSGPLDVSKCYFDFSSYIKKNGYNGFEPSENENENWTVTVSCTCTNPGTEVLYNAKGEIIAESYIAPMAHNPVQGIVIGKNISAGVKTSSLETNSIIEYSTYLSSSELQSKFKQQGGCIIEYCSKCSAVLETAYSPVRSCSHSSTTEKTERVSTCSVEGISITYCNICNNTIATKLLALSEHSQTVITKAATCSEHGTTTIKCKVCGIIMNYRDNGFAEHVGNWTVSVPAKGLVAGEESCTCTLCGKDVSREILPLMMCDLDYDKKVSASDARLALRIAVSLDKADEVLISVADVDNDKSITSTDARLILRLSVKLENYNELVKKYYNIAL